MAHFAAVIKRAASRSNHRCGCRQTAFAELLGCAASCGYLALLMREVDGVTPDTRVPLAAAERVAQQPARALALALAAYRCAAASGSEVDRLNCGAHGAAAGARAGAGVRSLQVRGMKWCYRRQARL